MRGNRSNDQLYRKYIAQLTSAYRNREDIRMFVELLLTLSAIIIFSLFAVRPTLITIGGLTTEISKKQETLSLLEQKVENISKAQNEMAQKAQDISLLTTSVPDQPSVPSFIFQLEKIVEENQVEIFALTAGEVPLIDLSGETQEKSLAASITLTGNYLSLLSSLKQIEQMRRPFAVSGGGIIQNGEQSSVSLLFSYTGDMPYLPKPLLN